METVQFTSVIAKVLNRPSNPVGVRMKVPRTEVLCSGQRHGGKQPRWKLLSELSR